MRPAPSLVLSDLRAGMQATNAGWDGSGTEEGGSSSLPFPRSSRLAPQKDWDPDGDQSDVSDRDTDIGATRLTFPGTKGTPTYQIYPVDNVIVPDVAVPGLSALADTLGGL